MFATKAPTAEDLRIEASNRKREVERHRCYVVALRADILGTADVIKKMRADADAMEAALVNRERRLRNAEDKLLRMERALSV